MNESWLHCQYAPILKNIPLLHVHLAGKNYDQS